MRDITQLNPELQMRIEWLQALCKKQGLKILITDCVRTKEEQDACYNRGASKVKYPNSYHCFGAAADFCQNKKGKEYDPAFMNKVGKLIKEVGLIWGGDWKSFVDKPHMQLAKWGDSIADLKQQYKTPELFKMSWNPLATATFLTGTRVRKTTDEKADVIATIPRGKKCVVLQKGAKVTKVLYQDKVGWVKTKYIKYV